MLFGSVCSIIFSSSNQERVKMHTDIGFAHTRFFFIIQQCMWLRPQYHCKISPQGWNIPILTCRITDILVCSANMMFNKDTFFHLNQNCKLRVKISVTDMMYKHGGRKLPEIWGGWGNCITVGSFKYLHLKCVIQAIIE